jgi:uncharacterized protein (TIGR03118 family)
MTSWLRRRLFGRAKEAGGPARHYRPVLEALEDRSLPSLTGVVTNLVSDVPGVAQHTDPNLVNPWGISYNPTGFFWLSENGTGVSDLLDGDGQQQPLVVSVPSAQAGPGQPTGTVFNGGSGFNITWKGVTGPARFLFAGEDGTISAWNSAVGLNRAFVVVNDSHEGADYTGLTLATDPAGKSYLYAADFAGGSIDVYDQAFHSVSYAGAFRDPNLPAGYSPFNVQNIDGRLFVTYAQHGWGRESSPIGGVIDVYDTRGDLLQRFAAGGPLNDPWGLAQAPSGAFQGALLVGNQGDGHINAFDPVTGKFLGSLTDAHGTPLSIPGLWGVSFGNGHLAGSSDALFFTSGPAQGQHGLFGSIRDPQAPMLPAVKTYVFDPSDEEYPLPPEDGPSLPKPADTAMPTVVFLPLSSSSVALAPALSGVQESAMGTAGNTRSDAPFAPLAVAYGYGGLLAPAGESSGPGSEPVAALPAHEVRGSALPDLNVLLDVGFPTSIEVFPSGIQGPTREVGAGFSGTPAGNRLVMVAGQPAATGEAQTEAATGATTLEETIIPSWRGFYEDLLGKLVLATGFSLAWYCLTGTRPDREKL